MENKTNQTKKLVLSGLLIAIVIILQYLGSFIHFGPFSVSLVLIPIVVGAAVCGKHIGALLGAVFGVVVLMLDSSAFLAVSPIGTFLTVMIKGIVCGFMAGYVYDLLKSKSTYLAVTVSAIVCPVFNTGIFLIGCKLFFMSLINTWCKEAGFESAGQYMIVGLVGMNFVIELIINLVLSPVIVKLIKNK